MTTISGAGASTSDLRGQSPDHDGAVGPESGAAPQPLVVGLDLSLTATGMSDAVTTWLVRSKGAAGDDLRMRHDRLHYLARNVGENVRDDTALVVIEQPAFSRTTGHMHDRSGLWWLVVDDLMARGIPVAEVAPTALKKYATGKGNANKGAVIDATARRFPDVATGADDNRCDALWLAAMGVDHLTGQHVVPESHREGLGKVVWPEVTT